MVIASVSTSYHVIVSYFLFFFLLMFSYFHPLFASLLLYFHRGAFVIKIPFTASYHNYANSLMSEANVIDISVHYRRAPEHHVHAAFENHVLTQVARNIHTIDELGLRRLRPPSPLLEEVVSAAIARPFRHGT
ncbi:hypothetical protein K1719_014463 [Acacia pycnantha]|nr:hypothetical protein K1719_038460 [Acacia pycnantha]KAI9114765.1 hypothetical protein K1719_014463 [Acacia pycnantha]